MPGCPVGIARMIATMSELGSDDLELARAGDAAAFLRLVQPFDRELRSFTYRMLGDRSAMDDVLQDVYLAAFRSIGRFRGEATARTWLYRIARNRCLDVIRARRYHEDIEDHPVSIGSFDTSVTERIDLAHALARLGPEHREVLMLVDAAGFDYAAAAEILGVRIGTIRSRLARARSRMRSLLEGDDHE